MPEGEKKKHFLPETRRETASPRAGAAAEGEGGYPQNRPEIEFE